MGVFFLVLRDELNTPTAGERSKRHHRFELLEHTMHATILVRQMIDYWEQ